MALLNIKHTVKGKLPTSFGEFDTHGYIHDGKEHLVLSMGELESQTDMLCRVHSQCLTGEVMHSLRCDCNEQLEVALETIAKRRRGILIYLRQEGRGIGLIEKLKAYNLQDSGMDTVEANKALGHEVDSRDFSIAAAILRDLKVKSINIMTNNLTKISQLEANQIEVLSRTAIIPKKITQYNKKYLATKQAKLGHLL